MPTWRDYVRTVIPYTPGEQPKEADVVKLNTNENPYPPAPGVGRVLQETDASLLRRYPDPAITDLAQALADTYGVKKEQVFVGVGSDDVLAMCFLTFFGSSLPILFPDITYSFYDVWADLFRIPYAQVPLDENFCIRVADYACQNGGVVIANPNAPTGVALPLSAIEEVLEANRDHVVIVDEAYVDFDCPSALPLIEKYDNLLVVQTMSKSRALAGMRIGYCFGQEELIRCLQDVKYSFNSYTMNRLSIACGVAALEDKAYFEEKRDELIATREWSKEELKKLGFSFGDSKANFIFASHREMPAKEIFESLKKKHIYVRYWSKPRINNHLRISIGTREEMEKLFSALREILGA